MTEPPAIQQICLSLSAERNDNSSAAAASLERQKDDLKTIRGALQKKKADAEGLVSILLQRHSPFVICISDCFTSHVRNLHRVLDKAIIDIIDRWFTDKEANFPGHMPLEKHEEELLRWLDGPGRDIVPRFGERYGMWRTDYLVERDSDGMERAVICEINSRIPFNGLWVVGLHEEATALLGAREKGFKPANDFDITRKAVFDCFDQTKPLHHIRSKWPGVDSHALGTEWQRRTGKPFRLVEPSQLRLQPNPHSPTGYSLVYSPEIPHNSEQKPLHSTPEDIHQCSLELFQEEFATLSPLILRQVSTCCINDLRNVFLVHDKRLLGIILEDLPSLVSRRVLTPEESRELKRGIANTLLPGSFAVKDLLERSKTDPKMKDEYIIKAVRDASGHNIVLGSHLSQQQWLEILERQADHALLPSEDACVIQELVEHVWYDIVRHDCETTEPEKYHIIGSHHMINGKVDVHGPWRIGEELHVGLGEGEKGIVMSCVRRL